jgi:hypothetical protein
MWEGTVVRHVIGTSWLLAAAIAAWPSQAALGQVGQTPPPLRGVSKVITLVTVNFPEGKERPLVLTEDRLRTIVDLRLRTAGLRVLDSAEYNADPDIDPFVKLDLNVLNVSFQSGVQLGYAMSTHLSLLVIQRTSFNGAIAPAVLWQNSNLCTINLETVDADVEQAVRALMDQLLSDWLAANPPQR